MSDSTETSPGRGRHTPAIKLNRGPFRPVWHKAIGGFLIVLGAAVFMLNDFSPGALPGAHNEFYAVLGICVAASSVWWFGWFDRPPERR